MPAWFLDMEDHPSVWMIAVILYPGQTFKKLVQTKMPSIVTTVCGYLYAQQSGLRSTRENCCLGNAHCSSSSKKLSLESMQTHFHQLMECLTFVRQALKVWRFWGCMTGTHLDSICFQQKFDWHLLPRCIRLFSRLAVQSHLTWQCQMKLQMWTSGHRKGFAQSHGD